MNLEIFDNFLPDIEFKKLSDVLLSSDFPWYFNTGITNLSEIKYDQTKFQFTHTFYLNCGWKSNYGQVLDPLLKLIKPFAIFRIKANLTTITPNRNIHGYHTDVIYPSNSGLKSACYYVNTNNGSTVFESGEVVDSIANRLIVFDVNKQHSGTSSTDSARRVVINFIYFPTKNSNET